jgi:integrase
MRKATTGIRERHGRACPSKSGGRCACEPSIEAFVFSARDGKKIRKTFRGKGALSAAKAWRADANVGLRKGTLRAASPQTLRQAADAWLEGAKSGQIRTRSGDSYKPSAIRGYEAALVQRVLPDLGAWKLGDIRRNDLQDLAQRLLAEGLDPSSIRNVLMPVRAVYRRAVSRGDITVNPTAGLELPAVRGRRDRIASPTEAAELLAAVPEGDRALWATALYAGLRRGELLALRWEDVDLAKGVIRVERSWDLKVGPVETKSRAGQRIVPIAAVLRDHLIEHKLAAVWSEGLAFGRAPDRPFNDSAVRRRAQTAWRRKRLGRAAAFARQEGYDLDQLTGSQRGRFLEKAGYEPISWHECRHTFASLMIAAGVNAKALSTYMGHSSITITLDRYGHLFPGNEEQAAALLDAYLREVTTRPAVRAVRDDSPDLACPTTVTSRG